LPLPGGEPCFYRFAGDKCFADSPIDDAHYGTNKEGYYVRDLLKVFAMLALFLDRIEELQAIQGTETNWVGGPHGRARLFATEPGLTIPSA
jgi:hypothetical protein